MDIQENIVYDIESKRTCDIYSNIDSPTRHVKGVIVIVHGGAWMIGDKRKMKSIAVTLCKLTGATCVVPEYSLSQLDHILLRNIIIVDWVLLAALCVIVRKQKFVRFFFLCLGICITICILVYLIRRSERKRNTHPAHVKDIAACVTWIATSSENHVNALKTCNGRSIFILGHSAGAHLAALVSLNARFLTPSVRACVKGVVCISGVYCFWRLQESLWRHFLNRGVFDEKAIGLTRENYECLEMTKRCICNRCVSLTTRWENVKDAWPIFHIDGNTAHKPSFLVLTSELDLTLLTHAVDFVKSLKEHNFAVQHVHFPQTTHFSIRKFWDHKHSHISKCISQFLLYLMSKNTIIN